MEIVILLLKIVLTLFFIGYGFTAVFIPEKLRHDSFWLAPWFGTILIAVLGTILSLAGIPIIKSKYIIFSLAAILFLWSLFNKNRLLFLSKDTILISLFTVICLLFNLYPLVTKIGFPTTISLSNLDPISYVHTGDFLKNHTVYEDGQFGSYKPYSWATVDLLHYGYRWGTPMVLGFVSSVLNMKSYQIFSILITIFFALSFPVVYILAKQMVDLKKSYLLLFLIFLTYSFNSTILYMLYNVFFAQFAFLGIFAVIVILLYSYFSEKNKLINFNNYDLLIGLSLSSLTILYLEGLFFILIPLVLFLTLNLLKKKNLALIYIAKIILLLFIINPISFGNALRVNYLFFVNTTKTTLIGWEKIRYAKPLEMLGFYNLYFSKQIPYLIESISSLIVIGVIIIGYLKNKQKLFTMSFIGFYVFLYLIFALYFKNYFTYHRAVTYTLFFTSILFSIGMFYIMTLFKNNFIKLVIIGAFFLMSARSSYRTIYQLYWHPRIVDKSLISLTELSNNKSVVGPFYTSDVFLGEYDLWKRLWQEYFLTDKLIITRQNYPTEVNNLQNVSMVLSEKNYLEREDKKIVYKNIVWHNQYYVLGEILPLEVTQDLKKY